MKGIFGELFTAVAAAFRRFSLSYTPEPEKVRRLLVSIVVHAIPIIVLAAAQSTIFARFRPFGAVPDLMIWAVVVIAMYDGEKAGAAAGIAAGFIIEALCGVGLSLLPLVYFLIGAFVGILTRMYFANTIPMFMVYVLCVLFIRAFVTFIYINAENFSYTPSAAFTHAILPEAGATLLAAPFVYAFVWLTLKPLHLKKQD